MLIKVVLKEHTFMVLCFAIFEIVLGTKCGPDSNVPGYYTWRGHLYCPDQCCQDGYLSYNNADQCCACLAVPCWELSNVNTEIVCGETKGILYLEYHDVFGNTTVLYSYPADTYELVHKYGRIGLLPHNLCDFADTLLEMDLTDNFIEDIGRLHCLTELDTIRLDFNRVRHISNKTFTGMSKLRVLTMTYNLIESLEPNILTIGRYNIYFVDFSYNEIGAVDLTNIIRPGEFCALNMSHSNLEELTNDLNYHLEDIVYGPGDIDFQFTEFPSYINFTELGLESFNELPNYFDGTISIDTASLVCDCALYPLFTGLGKEVAHYWPNFGYQNMTCVNPESMRGVSLLDILESEEFEKLTCELNNCPYFPRCRCLDIPDQNKVVVNCTGGGLKHFPDEMPVGYWSNTNIELILTDNHITHFPDLDYLDRLVALDLQGNVIASVDHDALTSIDKETLINMPDQNLDQLPNKFMFKDPNLINFGPNPVLCDCFNLWIGDWVRYNDNQNNLKCKIKDGSIVLAELVTKDLLQCDLNILPIPAIVAPIGAFLALLLFGVGVCFVFKYDIMILLRRVRRGNFLSDNLIEFDVFISFSETNDDRFCFVEDYLAPALEDADYTTFCPWFNLSYGTDRDNSVTEALAKSNVFVVVLCSSYLYDYNSRFEFDRIWERFMADLNTQIIVINLDNLRGGEIPDKRLAAFRRTKVDISFCERNGTLIERLMERVGPPRGFSKRPNEPNKTGSDSEADEPNEDKEQDVGLNLKPHLSEKPLKDILMEKYFSLPVHERLNTPKTPNCVCKYRRCYLHNDALAPIKI